MRAAVLALGVSAAAAAAGASRLTVGPEIPLGSHEPGVAPHARTAPAIASDGDEIFVAYTRGEINGYHSLFAVRFDRHGALLTPQPIPLALRAEGFAVRPDSPRALWAGGHYIVFFRDHLNQAQAVRVTREGQVSPRVTLPLFAHESFDVATDGREIILVASRTDKLFRLGTDLQILGTIALDSAARGPAIAFGDGRYAIVSADAREVTARFLENGVLSRPARIGPANNSKGCNSRAAWTGSAFAAAWVECALGSDYGLVAWTPLTARGEAAGPLRAIDYIRDAGSDNQNVTLTPLDGDTVFVTWGGTYDVTRGQRFRMSGAPVGEPVAIGASPAAAFRTAHGSLVLMDAALRMTVIDAPAAAVLPDPLPLHPAVRMFPNETLLAAAATRDAVAVVRHSWRGPFSAGEAAIGVFAHDGSFLGDRAAEAWAAAVATDGKEFFVLLADRFGALWFHRAGAAATRVRLGQGLAAAEPRLVWTGAELLAVWRVEQRLWAVRLDRDGNHLGTELPLPIRWSPSYETRPRLAARHGRVLLAWHDDGRARVTQLDANGQPVGPVDEAHADVVLSGLWTDGATDVLAAVSRDQQRMSFALRTAGKSFVTAPGTIRHGRDSITTPALARTAAGFVVAYGTWTFPNARIRLALLADDGSPLEEHVLGEGRPEPVSLIEISPTELLAVYSRFASEPPYSGLARVFARRITIKDGRRDAPR